MLVQTCDNSKYIYFKKGEVFSAVQASGLGNKEETAKMILECIKTKRQFRIGWCIFFYNQLPR